MSVLPAKKRAAAARAKAAPAKVWAKDAPPQDTGEVEVPAGFGAKRVPALLRLAKTIDPAFQGTKRAEAIAVIKAELARRAAI
jgi:hypothetical protein